MTTKFITSICACMHAFTLANPQQLVIQSHKLKPQNKKKRSKTILVLQLLLYFCIELIPSHFYFFYCNCPVGSGRTITGNPLQMIDEVIWNKKMEKKEETTRDITS